MRSSAKLPRRLRMSAMKRGFCIDVSWNNRGRLLQLTPGRSALHGVDSIVAPPARRDLVQETMVARVVRPALRRARELRAQAPRVRAPPVHRQRVLALQERLERVLRVRQNRAG